MAARQPAALMGSAASQRMIETAHGAATLRARLLEATPPEATALEATPTEATPTEATPTDSDPTREGYGAQELEPFISIEPSAEAQRRLAHEDGLPSPNTEPAWRKREAPEPPALYLKSVRVLRPPNETVPAELLEEWEHNNREHSLVPVPRPHARASPPPRRGYRPPVQRPRHASPPPARGSRPPLGAQAAVTRDADGNIRFVGLTAQSAAHALEQLHGSGGPRGGRRFSRHLQGDPMTSTLVGGQECKVCMAAKIDCVLLNCGHLCACMSCADRLSSCPICREHIHRINKVYHV